MHNSGNAGSTPGTRGAVFECVVLITGAGSGIGAAPIAFHLPNEARRITGRLIHMNGGLTLG
jgi:NADP-dependent 3-hydroxy acid dehydrogenase YdfG